MPRLDSDHDTVRGGAAKGSSIVTVAGEAPCPLAAAIISSVRLSNMPPSAVALTINNDGSRKLMEAQAKYLPSCSSTT